ncbi:XRE family transcriptional regulator [Enterocloster citroniae]|nr:XRE family transcriptional regulator [Enterocloster citroniae]
MKDRIKKIRKELDLTQQCFAEKIGTTANVLTNYETGRRNPSASVINNICKTFDVNEDWFRTGKGEMFVQRTKNQIITDFLGDLVMEDVTFKKRLIEALAELDDRDWEGLEKLANKLISKMD